MGRRALTGLTYFPMDVDIHNDQKFLEALELIDPEGQNFFIRAVAENFLSRIYCKIYSAGYYLTWTHQDALEIAKSLYTTSTHLKNILNSFLQTELLSAEVFDKHSVLTSRGIQKRWLKIMSVKRRKIEIDQRFRLVDNSKKRKKTEITSEEKQDNFRRNDAKLREKHKKGVVVYGFPADQENKFGSYRVFLPTKTAFMSDMCTYLPKKTRFPFYYNTNTNSNTIVSKYYKDKNKETSEEKPITSEVIPETSVRKLNNSKNNEFLQEIPVEKCSQMFFESDFFQKTLYQLTNMFTKSGEEPEGTINRLKIWANVLVEYQISQGDLYRPMTGNTGWVGYFSNWLKKQGEAIYDYPTENYKPKSAKQYERHAVIKEGTFGGISKSKIRDFLGRSSNE